MPITPVHGPIRTWLGYDVLARGISRFATKARPRGTEVHRVPPSTPCSRRGNPETGLFFARRTEESDRTMRRSPGHNGEKLCKGSGYGNSFENLHPCAPGRPLGFISSDVAVSQSVDMIRPFASGPRTAHKCRR